VNFHTNPAHTPCSQQITPDKPKPTLLPAFNHSTSNDSEREYDRLRDAARHEQSQHQSLAARSQQAYQSGDGGAAHDLSLQSKSHAAKADELNKQASEYIFRENNAVGRVDSDTIDLHGQFVEEAEEILEQRIRHAQQTGQGHLHVIVGKGNHSVGHVQKIKPKVEEICRELGLQYNTEQNEGRIYIDLRQGGHGGAPPQMPHFDYGKQHQPQHAQYGQPHHTTAYPMSGGYPGQQQQPQMQYGGGQQQQQQHGQQHGQPQQQMQYQEPEGQKDEGIKCCGIKICVVM
jgi:DNA-nicking Smr family endonuclease